MSRSRFEELYALHALESLEASERESFEAHLATGCPECREGLAQARAVLPALALSVPPEEPPASLRERILLRARRESTPPSVRRASPVRRLLPLSLAASLAALAILGLAHLRVRDAERERARLVALLADPSAPRAIVKREESPVATAVFDRDRREILLFARDLGAPPAGKTFVLWLLPKDAGAPRNVGSLPAIASGMADAVIREPGPIDGIAGVAVSEEIDPGTPAPTKVVGVGLF